MVAQQGYLLQDKHDRSDVGEILERNPDIRAMVEKIAGHAASLFRWMSVSLDTRQYDEWDPPARLIITVPYLDREEWTRQYRSFVDWLAQQSDYDPDRLFTMVVPQALEKQE